MGPLVRLHPDVGDDNPFPVSFRNAVRNLQLGTRREVVAIAKRSLADARDDKIRGGARDDKKGWVLGTTRKWGCSG